MAQRKRRSRKTLLAIAYDFDGTLAPGNMQNRNFIPAIGLNPSRFWTDVKEHAKKHNGDEILSYMNLMLTRAAEESVQVRRRNFRDFGAKLDLFPGVENWFPRITEFAAEQGVTIEHYVISSGLREMINGTSIKRYFKLIFASAFEYDHHGVARWPAVAINYTTKTQYLFRINKGILNCFDNEGINQYTPEGERRIPFRNMVYIGDGDTDVPCMKMIKYQGGYAIAVYQSGRHGARTRAMNLVEQERADYVFTADYRPSAPLSMAVEDIVRKVAAENRLLRVGKPNS